MWQRSTTRRFLKWLFSWRTARRALIGLACLVTLVALFYAEENWRGRRAWERYRRTLEAQGESLTLAALVPPPVPDEQNFAMTPLLKPLFPTGSDYAEKLGKRLDLPEAARDKIQPEFGDWAMSRPIALKEWREYLGTTNLLQFLKRFGPELDEITAASRRPYSRFPLRYEDGFMMLLPHISPLRQAARLYVLRASAELAEGQTDRAAADVVTIFRLSDSLAEEPLTISVLVRSIFLKFGLQVVWEGLSRHQWSDGQLAMFQDELQRMDFLSGGLRAFQGERACFIDTLDRAITQPQILVMVFYCGPNSPDRACVSAVRLLPRGWLYQNMLTGVRCFQEQVLPTINLAERRVYPQRTEAIEKQLSHMRSTPYNLFLKLLMPALPPCCTRFAATQVAVDEATMACALERYRLAHGEFPERLDALAPQFLGKLPHDVINGAPYHYRRTADGRFVLYSVGWNETDDGGQVALAQSKPARQDLERGDWVWQYPPRK
jgi:hypothetical protein